MGAGPILLPDSGIPVLLVGPREKCQSGCSHRGGAGQPLTLGQEDTGILPLSEATMDTIWMLASLLTVTCFVSSWTSLRLATSKNAESEGTGLPHGELDLI